MAAPQGYLYGDSARILNNVQKQEASAPGARVVANSQLRWFVLCKGRRASTICFPLRFYYVPAAEGMGLGAVQLQYVLFCLNAACFESTNFKRGAGCTTTERQRYSLLDTCLSSRPRLKPMHV